MKKIVLIFCLFLSFNINAATSGSCAGDENSTCQWSFDEASETLIISGQGTMQNFENYYKDNISGWRTTAPWADFPNLKNVVVQDGITSIGYFAFYSTEIENISLPTSVVRIGEGAFQGARKLKELTLPNNLRNIGSKAFNNMDGLVSIIIPDSLSVYPRHSFSESDHLVNIVISDQATDIDKLAFYDLPLNTAIYCKGDLALCKEHIGEEMKDRVTQAFEKKINGKTYILDKNGNIVATSGNRINKRIYTIDEANAVAKPTGNTVRIKYR